jgi:ABC-type sugar transport system permease subunit
MPVLPFTWKKTNHRLSLARSKRRWGLLLISPWVIGFVLFKMAPILATLVISFPGKVT